MISGLFIYWKIHWQFCLLSQQIGNFDYFKIFAPVFENGKLITTSLTILASAYPIPIVGNLNLDHFVCTKIYNTVKELQNLRCPTKVHIKLKFLDIPTPISMEYRLPEFVNALDPDGDLIDVTMCPKIAKNILVRLIKTIPVNHKYLFRSKATAVNEAGDEVLVAMYAKTWEDVVIGQIYTCHHLQIGNYKSYRNGGNQLRTLPFSTFTQTNDF